ncbi:unnamed protein product [Clonostachys solani]|uniref:Xylanolytic transcriptional activator regulatory domain-containing protein n=1 Tax=Clonostachys solani TaxID=160281 RepID=A0A9P0EP86_9HYPO|nr:unnamed protein product [Clonostachys solani]
MEGHSQDQDGNAGSTPFWPGNPPPRRLHDYQCDADQPAFVSYECKKRKTKCDSAHPCGQCAKGGRKFSHIYSGAAETRQILDRLCNIEDQMRPLRSASPVASDPASCSEVRDAGPGPPELTDDNSTLGPSSLELPPPEDPPASRRAAMGPEVPHNRHDALDIGAPAEPSPISSALSTNCCPGSETGTARIYTPATAHYKFNIDLAQTNLLARGICPPARNGTTANASRAASPSPRGISPTTTPVDPVWLIDRREAMRLCNVYEEEINLSHPFLDMATIRDNVKRLYDAIDVLVGYGCTEMPLNATTILERDELHIIKLVFATALITETGGPGGLTGALFNDVKFSTRDRFWEDITLPTIIIFFLLAMWQFLADNDRLAWRLTGFVARWCLEIGLNQSRFFQKLPASDHDGKMAVRLFWCIHALDRRWGFGNGLPFVIQDSDVDDKYPQPDDDVPYLKAMVAFSHIMSAVWSASYASPIDRSKPQGRDEASYLDFRITKWWDELPADLKLSGQDDQLPRGMMRLRILLYLRRCQLKILLHQPVLHSPLLLHNHAQVADGVVQLAKDVIRRLDDLHRLTDIYSTQQMCFNYFLVLSLGVIFLAITQAPERFVRTVQVEFNTALDLIESLSSKSYVSRRLWRFIKSLRPLGDRLGAKDATQAAHAGDHDQGHIVPDQIDPFPELGMGVFYSAEDGFTQLFDEPIDTEQLMESMKSIFDAIEVDST